MFDHVLSLGFGTSQVCRQVERYTNLLAQMFKEAMGTYQL